MHPGRTTLRSEPTKKATWCCGRKQWTARLQNLEVTVFLFAAVVGIAMVVDLSRTVTYKIKSNDMRPIELSSVGLDHWKRIILADILVATVWYVVANVAIEGPLFMVDPSVSIAISTTNAAIYGTIRAAVFVAVAAVATWQLLNEPKVLQFKDAVVGAIYSRGHVAHGDCGDGPEACGPAVSRCVERHCRHHCHVHFPAETTLSGAANCRRWLRRRQTCSLLARCLQCPTLCRRLPSTSLQPRWRCRLRRLEL